MRSGRAAAVLQFDEFRFSSKVSAFDEFRWVRFCSRGLDGTGSGNRVLGTRGIKKVPGSGDSVAKVPKVLICTLPQCLLQVALKINTARAKKRRQSMSTL